jgi:hypothetical protein
VGACGAKTRGDWACARRSRRACPLFVDGVEPTVAALSRPIEPPRRFVRRSSPAVEVGDQARVPVGECSERGEGLSRSWRWPRIFPDRLQEHSPHSPHSLTGRCFPGAAVAQGGKRAEEACVSANAGRAPLGGPSGLRRWISGQPTSGVEGQGVPHLTLSGGREVALEHPPLPLGRSLP